MWDQGVKIPPKYTDVPHKYFMKDWHVKIALINIFWEAIFLYISGNLAKNH